MLSNKLLLLGVILSSAAFAGGLEKNVLWSGHYQGFGGAAVSSVNDSEALYFNPAGLVRLNGNGDVRLNFSPTFSKFKGPVLDGETKESELGISPVGGVTGAYRLSDTLVLGVGAFVSGGTNTYYKDVGPAKGAAQSSLDLVDFTIGAAAKVTNEFSLGLAWRATYAKASLATVASNGTTEVKLTDLKSWDFGSFRVGAQYRKDDLGVGLNVRTPVKLTLNGDAELYNAGPFSGQFSNVNVSAEFPFLVALGTDYKFAKKWTLFTEVSWANYSADEKLDIQENTGNAVLTDVANKDIILKWRDQWVGRIGTEWQMLPAWALRFGYVLTSAVTSDKHARATFTAPGIGHSFCAGVGTHFGALDTNLAFDYSIVKGHGQNVIDGYSGEFETTSYTAHLGVGYTF